MLWPQALRLLHVFEIRGEVFRAVSLQGLLYEISCVFDDSILRERGG